MNYEVLKEMKVKSLGKELIVPIGRIIYLQDHLTNKLLTEGKIKLIISNQTVDIKAIEEMTLEEFSKSNTKIKVFSRLLNETILFVSTDEILNKDDLDNFIFYKADELMKLSNSNSEHLKRVHQIKKNFKGSEVTEFTQQAMGG
jgi:alpha-N-acetylglucosamine transferase